MECSLKTIIIVVDAGSWRRRQNSSTDVSVLKRQHTGGNDLIEMIWFSVLLAAIWSNPSLKYETRKTRIPEVRVAPIRLPHSVPFLPSRLTHIIIGPSTLCHPFLSCNRPHTTTSFLYTDVDHFQDTLCHPSTPLHVPARTVLHLRLKFGAAFRFATNIRCWSWPFWCCDGSCGVMQEYPAWWHCLPGCIALSHQRVVFSYSNISTIVSGKSIPPCEMA